MLCLEMRSISLTYAKSRVPSAIPVSELGRYALIAPATSSKFVPLELRDGRDGDTLTLTLPSVVVDIGLGGAPPNAVEPNVLPATARVDVIGVK